VLLKSRDSSDSKKDLEVNKNSKEGEYEDMTKEVTARIQELLKENTSKEDILKALTEDKELKLTKEAVEEAGNAVELYLGINPPKAEKEEKEEKEVKEVKEVKKEDKEKKEVKKEEKEEVKKEEKTSIVSKEEFEETKARLEKAEALILSQSENAEKRELSDWVEKNCPHFPGDASVAVDHLHKLEKNDKEAAKFFKETLVSASIAASHPQLFKELGTGQEGRLDNVDVLGREYFKQVDERTRELKKSSQDVDEAAVIEDIVKGIGADAYDNYRREHIRRAKTF
jgi:hypothetical protein